MSEAARMTPDEMTEMVRGLTQNRYFLATMIPEQTMISLVFMPLMGGFGDTDPTTIGMVLEEYDKAGPRSINGLPCFFSCKIVHVDDWASIADRANRAIQAMNAVLDE